TLTHEVGHWLNLRHIWGDATCGNDFVSDTPTQETSNFGCVSFPHITCGNGPNGDQYMNYMDYSNGNCQNMFSMGQRDRMHAALNSAVSSRNNLWSTANLAATGVDQLQTLCAPEADFCQDPIRVCEGDQVTFTDFSTNGDVANWNWSFPGGTPSTSNAQNPMVTYNNHGIYDVTLTVDNATGQSTKTRQKHVIVSRAAAWYTVPFSEGFENILFPGGFWHVENAGGNAWEQTAQTAYTGTQCIKLQNYTGNTQEPDAFITPTYNLSNVSSTMMTFKLAFAARSSTNVDKLQIFASTNCGRTWSLRYTKSGLALATAGLVSSNFIPTGQSQWREETVNFSTSSVSGRDNVMFKFVYTNDSGNNMYIDDINLTGVVGQEEILDELLQLSIFPNPTENISTVAFNLGENKEMSIYVTDMTGRIVENVEENQLSAGDHSYQIGSGLSKGMYFVHLNVDGQLISKKFVLK
ncbi:MAG: T9SS type A sorting domain-containing protein, partial [Bacteroidia bacterium]|nr:T9SS type A sorting domain-containing protein [Bacteroidia bacterium]